MSNKIILGVVIVGVIAVGGYFALTSKKGEENKNDGTVQEATEQKSDKKMAFSEFVKQGGSYKCEVKQSVSGMENNGTVYISGNNIRGEYTSTAEGKTIQTWFIMRDGYSYTWSSVAPAMGFKVRVAENVAGDANANTQGTYKWSAEQIGDYNCEAWVADQSKFALPASVTFQEVGGWN